MSAQRVVGQHLNVAQRIEIVALGRESVPVAEIMSRTGAARNTVNAILRKVGIEPTKLPPKPPKPVALYPERYECSIDDGVMIVASDGHYWPGNASVTHRGLLWAIERLKPKVFVLNGDAFDGAKVSRHARIGWDERPEVVDELDACKERLNEIKRALPRRAVRVWTLGNHDARFETKLANDAPDYAHVHGFKLSDHFPGWEKAWSCFVNDDVVVKHRFKGGIHAPWNNVMWAGRTIVTGHLHSAKVAPFTNYNGTHFGVDTGCVADVRGRQFVDYTEDNPKNWVSAFGVFTFRRGRLLWPELVVAYSQDEIQFRGEVIRV